MADLIKLNDSGTGLSVTVNAYDPKITPDINAKIRNWGPVRARCNEVAERIKNLAGQGFVVIRAGGPSRYRAYVAPDTDEAINAELTDGVLLKAALSQQGK